MALSLSLSLSLSPPFCRHVLRSPGGGKRRVHARPQKKAASSFSALIKNTFVGAPHLNGKAVAFNDWAELRYVHTVHCTLYTHTHTWKFFVRMTHSVFVCVCVCVYVYMCCHSRCLVSYLSPDVCVCACVRRRKERERERNELNNLLLLAQGILYRHFATELQFNSLFI